MVMSHFTPNERDSSPPRFEVAQQGLNYEPVERNTISEQQYSFDKHYSAIRALESQFQALKIELEEQRALVAKKDADLQRTRNEYASLKTLHEEKCELLEHRTTKLRLLEKYAVDQDEVSAVEVENYVADINSQILTIAGTCTNLDNLQEWFKRPKKRRDHPAELSSDMISNLGAIVGEKLLVVLARLDYVEDQIAVQLSMQAIMCFFVARVCDIYPYSPTRRAKSGKGIWDIYPEIHSNEIQAVAARWRSIGSKHSKAPGTFDELLKEITICSSQYLSRVLLAAGVHTDVSILQRYCEHRVGDSLKVMWTVVLQYAEKQKERVFSTDYSLISFPARADYDPAVMKLRGSAPDKEKTTPGGKVLCTIELGLQRDTNHAKPGESTIDKVKKDIIVKGIVILDEELIAMLGSHQGKA